MTDRESTYESLKNRVAALGHQLIEDDWTEADRDERPAPGLYVLDPTTSKLVLICPNSGNSDDRAKALREIQDWCVDAETDRADAIADDFNSPNVRAKYEHFLSLIVVAGLKDRLKAMDIRKAEGIDAAIEYVGNSTLTRETDRVDATKGAEPRMNPISAFVKATVWLRGTADPEQDGGRGRDLVALMAAQIEYQDDDNPTLPLTVSDCVDVLEFLSYRETKEPGDVCLGGSSDDVSRKYGGDPSFGLYLILGHIQQQLAKAGAA